MACFARLKHHYLQQTQSRSGHRAVFLQLMQAVNQCRGPAMMPARGVGYISDRLQPTSGRGFQMTGRGWDEVHEHIVQPAHHDEARRSDRSTYLQVTVTFSETTEMPTLAVR